MAATTSSAPSLRFSPIPASLLGFPPASIPATLPPPSAHSTLAHPFRIPPGIYNSLLAVQVPITVAIIYASTVTYLNRYNERRGLKPWALSRTKAFANFVIAHNVLLAVYSFWTFIGLVNALRASLGGAEGLVGVVDVLCKINGPRGLGNAATFSPTSKVWSFATSALKLGADDLPDQADVGRIWNEGLAFYGWLFYLSKFYEVVDTLIILAKGKKSSFLQTYHHAGAMMSMWAGIRYMAPPIWMFVVVNSFVHTLMYTYYTFTALKFRVPQPVKQIITTLQIAQFIVGTIFAFTHLFVAYTVPASVPYIYSLGDISSAVSADVASAASTATATATAGIASWLKKLAFRAAGEEGLAENVLNEEGKAFGVDALHAAKDLKARQEIRYREELRTIHCTDTSGQVFAILLNCLYLAPLTWLFVQFFIKAYTKREDAQGKPSNVAEVKNLLGKSTKDAAKGVEREIKQAFDEQPATPEVVDEQPATPEVVDEQPATPEVVDEQPATPEVVDEQPATPEVVDEQPATPEVVDEQPATPEVVDEQPATHEVVDEIQK